MLIYTSIIIQDTSIIDKLFSLIQIKYKTFQVQWSPINTMKHINPRFIVTVYIAKSQHDNCLRFWLILR